MKREKMQRIKYFGGMALCVILSVLIFTFGKHDRDITEITGTVDAIYEQMDGDLDFGQMGDISQIMQATPTPVPTATPFLDNPDADGQPGIGTEEDPLLIADEMFSYQVINGKAMVAEVLDTAAEELVIPQRIDGYPVTVIGEYLCQGLTMLKKVTLPEGLLEINAYAFESCVALEEINFPSTLTTIRDSAFFSCNGLKEIVLPKSVTILEDYAFYACDNLQVLTLYKTSDISMVFDLSAIVKVTIGEGVSYIDESAFEYCETLTEVSLPSTLTSIKAYAFYGCTALERVVLPAGVVSIGENAFENCTLLSEINLPDSLMLISEYAFCGCEALEVLSIPGEVASIGDGVFDGCDNLVLRVTAESTGEEYAIANDLLYEVK